MAANTSPTTTATTDTMMTMLDVRAPVASCGAGVVLAGGDTGPAVLGVDVGVGVVLPFPGGPVGADVGVPFE
jgi:hypothetical protein